MTDDAARDGWNDKVVKLEDLAMKLGFKGLSADEEDVSFDPFL